MATRVSTYMHFLPPIEHNVLNVNMHAVFIIQL